MNRMIPSPPQPAPIGNGTYTTWPGGVDPTARLFNTDNQKIPCTGTAVGGARRSRTRRALKGGRRIVARKTKNTRKDRKSRKSRKSRRQCGGRRN